MSIKEAELEALRICALCDKGIHPREHEREKRNNELSFIKEKKKQVRTLSEVLEKYVVNKRLQQQNSESYIRERDNCLKAICSDWFNEPIINISFPEVEERFNKVAYRKGTLGRALLCKDIKSDKLSGYVFLKDFNYKTIGHYFKNDKFKVNSNIFSYTLVPEAIKLFGNAIIINRKTLQIEGSSGFIFSQCELYDPKKVQARIEKHTKELQEKYDKKQAKENKI